MSKKNLNTIKYVMRAEFKIMLMASIIWSILGPYKNNLQGLLEVETISFILIISACSYEFLPLLKNKLNFKQTNFWFIVTDILLTLLILIAWCYDDDRLLILIILIGLIPSSLFISLLSIKFTALISKHYNHKILESFDTRIQLLSSRTMLLGFTITGIIGSLSLESFIIPVFVVGSVIQSFYSFYIYNKYVKHIV